jgi:hypothetical protein
MRIVGEWFACADGVVRPVLEGYAADFNGTECHERFLVDTGADITVLTAPFFQRLRLPSRLPQTGATLTGVGGGFQCVLVQTTLTLYAEDKSPARIQGEFAAFTDPAAADMSILGRDILDHFHLIVSRPWNEVVLLALNHHYQIQSP